MNMGLSDQALQRDGKQKKCDESEATKADAQPIGSPAPAKGLVNRNPQGGLPARHSITLSLFAG
jgi:hypothetical protein